MKIKMLALGFGLTTALTSVALITLLAVGRELRRHVTTGT